MKVVIDTNVFISGVFFHGPPYQILKAWHDGRIQLVISENIGSKSPWRRLDVECTTQVRML